MCPESPQLFYSPLIGDESSNEIKHSGQTENCGLFSSFPNGLIIAERGTDLGKCFENMFENSILHSSRSDGI